MCVCVCVCVPPALHLCFKKAIGHFSKSVFLEGSIATEQWCKSNAGPVFWLLTKIIYCYAIKHTRKIYLVHNSSQENCRNCLSCSLLFSCLLPCKTATTHIVIFLLFFKINCHFLTKTYHFYHFLTKILLLFPPLSTVLKYRCCLYMYVNNAA